MNLICIRACLSSLFVGVLSVSTPVVASAKMHATAPDSQQTAQQLDKSPVSELVNGKLPEPEIWELMIIGMALVGFSIRYRQRTISLLDVS